MTRENCALEILNSRSLWLCLEKVEGQTGERSKVFWVKWVGVDVTELTSVTLAPGESARAESTVCYERVNQPHQLYQFILKLYQLNQSKTSIIQT